MTPTSTVSGTSEFFTPLEEEPSGSADEEDDELAAPTLARRASSIPLVDLCALSPSGDEDAADGDGGSDETESPVTVCAEINHLHRPLSVRNGSFDEASQHTLSS